VSVKITFGKPFEAFPWIVADKTVVAPASDVLVLIRLTSGRVKIASGMFEKGKWGVNITGVTKSMTLKVIAWHPNNCSVDAGRAWKAIRWVEKQFGLLKVKNQTEWMEAFYTAWKDKPWA
jgi:hypothetical protein